VSLLWSLGIVFAFCSTKISLLWSYEDLNLLDSLLDLVSTLLEREPYIQHSLSEVESDVDCISEVLLKLYCTIQVKKSPTNS